MTQSSLRINLPISLICNNELFQAISRLHNFYLSFETTVTIEVIEVTITHTSKSLSLMKKLISTVNYENIHLLKAYHEVEDGSGLKLANHVEMGYVVGRGGTGYSREDGKL